MDGRKPRRNGFSAARAIDIAGDTGYNKLIEFEHFGGILCSKIPKKPWTSWSRCAKNRGYVFAGSEIYGGLANTWDYGPLGVELKNNIKRAWWKKFVQENPYNVGLDSAILMNPQTWVASGHLGGFSDPLMDCRECKERFRADKLIEDLLRRAGRGAAEAHRRLLAGRDEGLHRREAQHLLPTCGKHNFTDIRQFNLMFKTFQGVTEDAKNTVYLRPETAQGIFVNFCQRPAHHAPKSCPSASARSASPSATRSRRATSSSACASLSRWSWSSSASRARTSSGSPTGAASASSGC